MSQQDATRDAGPPGRRRKLRTRLVSLSKGRKGSSTAAAAAAVAAVAAAAAGRTPPAATTRKRTGSRLFFFRTTTNTAVPADGAGAAGDGAQDGEPGESDGEGANTRNGSGLAAEGDGPAGSESLLVRVTEYVQHLLGEEEEGEEEEEAEGEGVFAAAPPPPPPPSAEVMLTAGLLDGRFMSVVRHGEGQTAVLLLVTDPSHLEAPQPGSPPPTASGNAGEGTDSVVALVAVVPILRHTTLSVSGDGEFVLSAPPNQHHHHFHRELARSASVDGAGGSGREREADADDGASPLPRMGGSLRSPHGAVVRYHFRSASVFSMWAAVHRILAFRETAEDSCRSWAWLGAYQRHIRPARQPSWVRLVKGHVADAHLRCRRRNSFSSDKVPQAKQAAKTAAAPGKDTAFERALVTALRRYIAECDLDSITGKQVREHLEAQFGCSLKAFKSFIDENMLTIFGQMEPASAIVDGFLYLGTEWNASNYDEMLENGVRFVLNVTDDIPNFFPEHLEYLRVSVIDEPQSNLLPHWEATTAFISRAREAGAKVLVHCQMGVSRSASCVAAYLMATRGWPLDQTLRFMKDRRTVVNPNPGFCKQLAAFSGMLRAKEGS